MKCKKCESENLKIIESGPHNKLVCGDCLAFQKFLSKKDAQIFEQTMREEKMDTEASPFDGEYYLEYISSDIVRLTKCR